jgi:transcriptional regulator with XRE-family HTH domain
MPTTESPSDLLRRALSPAKPHLTQTQLASELGVSPQAVSNWVAGRARPEPRFRADIERLTGVPRTLWMTDEELDAAGIRSAS